MHPIDRSIRFVRGDQAFLLIHGVGGTPIETRSLAHGFARTQLAEHCGSSDNLKVTNWMD
jgi:carboxylesterase